LDYIIVQHNRREGENVTNYFANMGFPLKYFDLDLIWPLIPWEYEMHVICNFIEENKTIHDGGIDTMVMDALERTPS